MREVINDIFIFSLTIFLIYLGLTSIRPNLSTDISKYSSTTRLLSETRMETRSIPCPTYRSLFNIYKSFQKCYKEELVLIMKDGTEWIVSDSKYWKQFQDTSNINKSFKIYLGNNLENHHPIQIEIEGKVIYGIKENIQSNYLMLGFTFGCVILSIFRLYNIKNRWEIGIKSLIDFFGS